MQNPGALITNLKRPKLLITAARMAQPEYRRGGLLRRVLGCEQLPGSNAAIMALLSIERDHDERRRAQDASYSPLRHLEVLIALLGEAARAAATKAAAETGHSA